MKKMKPFKTLLIRSILYFWWPILLINCCTSKEEKTEVTFCNPLNLNYRYQPEKPSRREAADPTVVLFKDKYYLFVSKTGGYL